MLAVRVEHLRKPAHGDPFGGDSALRVIIEPGSQAACQRAANVIAAQLRSKPASVLGLATGGTAMGVYRELVRLHREDGLDFSHAATFNLDEYVGLGPSHPQSYRAFMQEHLFNAVNVDPARTHVPDGRALDFDAHCRQYEQRIVAAGGIDLQLLGIGTDGHIAFTEPGSSLGSRTRLKSLAGETIRDNARFFGSEADVPRLAITMGVGTILESKRCLLVAMGSAKAAAIRNTVEGPITAQVTASALQMHQEVIAIVDEEAGAELQRREYYAEVEQAQQLLEDGQFRKLGMESS